MCIQPSRRFEIGSTHAPGSGAAADRRSGRGIGQGVDRRLLALEALLAGVLLGLPPYYLEPGDPSREPRLRLLAHELSDLPPATAAGLVAIGEPESHFAAYVAAGCLTIPKGAPNCDGRTSLGYWQLKRSTCPAGWGFPPWTIESLREQVACAARLWEGAAWRCLPRGGGFGCVWAARSWSAVRYSVILAKVQ